MQAKISAFFKPTRNPIEPQLRVFDQTNYNEDPEISAKEEELRQTQEIENAFRDGRFPAYTVKDTPAQFLNKKRNYAQLHFDLGQSDFLLHTCSICGFKYACGDEEDEKVHKEFHKEYTHGTRFKGWHNERAIKVPSTKAGRIILVLDGDPPARKKKAERVVQMMEMELGSGWLMHKLCKVYLFVSQQRVAGCLIAEPIRKAYRILQKSEASQSLNAAPAKKDESPSSILQFGDVTFQREGKKRASSLDNRGTAENDLIGAIFLETEAVPAVCGIRAIWVAPAMRRKHIASQLLDAARMSFCEGLVLKPSQLAFSQPTSTGKALASRYCETTSFLAYRTDV